MNQNLTWERSDGNADRFKRYLSRALLRSGVCLILEDGRSHYLFIANLFDAWRLPPGETPSDPVLFGPDLAARLGVLKAEVRRSGEAGQIEAGLDPDRYFRFIVEPIPSTDDVDVMTTIIETSEERRREKLLRDLLREVSHRSKNLLAIIQSIAAQTARHSDTIDVFVHKFRGRLYSLSLSQDLITDSLWRGARFRDLVAEQIGRYLPEIADRVEIEGGDALFSPNAALHLGLALHELIINAVTHGDTAESGLKIRVSCREVPDGDHTMINFVWKESRKAPASTSVEADREEAGRFGRAVLERVLPASVSGSARYEIGADEVLYTLVFPTDVRND